ncbi:MAG: hypothetical protein GF331_14145 [Chitinivibrionales bacterium]|nr:hypothetical protein [Chitinivibrionales bacterium]
MKQASYRKLFLPLVHTPARSRVPLHLASPRAPRHASCALCLTGAGRRISTPLSDSNTRKGAPMAIFHRTHFTTRPLFLAAWSGVGNAAILAVDYIRRSLDAVPFGHIDLSQLIVPDSVVVEGGTVKLPEDPRSVFYHHHRPDLVIFESTAHIGARVDVDTIESILSLAQELKTPRIYTAAAIPLSISHAEQSQVFCACSRPELTQEMTFAGLEPMPDGAISGPNGLLVGFAGTRGIDAVCLLAGIPTYAISLSYPRAALAIVEALNRLEVIDVDTSELAQSVEEVDETFTEIEEKIREFFTTTVAEHPHEESLPEVDGEDVPKYVMDRIERLFEEVRKDRSKGPELKRELDRWNLYPLYEHRFLDLFENGGE